MCIWTFFLTIALAISVSSAQSLPSNGVVARVIDGDTFTLTTGETVRLAGIDAPETHHPNKPVEWFGPESKAHLEYLVSGRTLRLEYDAQTIDKYERILAFAYVDDSVCVNLEMIQDGYALAFLRYECKYQSDYIAAEIQARTLALGMWASPTRLQGSSGATIDTSVIAPTKLSQPSAQSSVGVQQRYWINTKSGSRHNASCRWYGNTKRGYFTNEKKGKPCGGCGG